MRCENGHSILLPKKNAGIFLTGESTTASHRACDKSENKDAIGRASELMLPTRKRKEEGNVRT